MNIQNLKAIKDLSFYIVGNNFEGNVIALDDLLAYLEPLITNN